MKSRTIALMVLLFALSGCTGAQLRDSLLMPLASQVYMNLYPQIVAGISDAVASGDLSTDDGDKLTMAADAMKAAVLMGDKAGILAVDWPALEAMATREVQRRVDAGEISPFVATSLFQRIVNFRDLLQELTTPAWPTDTHSKSFYIGRYYLGELPQVDLKVDARLERHNRPRRELGVPEVTAEEIGL